MKRFLLAVGLVASFSPVLADEVTDAIEEGMTAYKNGDMGAAASQWEYAAQLVRQNKAANVAKLLPGPLSGWEAEDVDSSAAGASMFGGGINVSRSYHKGEDNVRIEMTMDSPMLQGVIGVLANPQFAAMSGQKIKKVKGNQAAVESADGFTKMQIVVGNSILIAVEGQPEKAVMDYADAINYQAISELK